MPGLSLSKLPLSVLHPSQGGLSLARLGSCVKLPACSTSTGFFSPIARPRARRHASAAHLGSPSATASTARFSPSSTSIPGCHSHQGSRSTVDHSLAVQSQSRHRRCGAVAREEEYSSICNVQEQPLLPSPTTPVLISMLAAILTLLTPSITPAATLLPSLPLLTLSETTSHSFSATNTTATETLPLVLFPIPCTPPNSDHGLAIQGAVQFQVSHALPMQSQSQREEPAPPAGPQQPQLYFTSATVLQTASMQYSSTTAAVQNKSSPPLLEDAEKGKPETDALRGKSSPGSIDFLISNKAALNLPPLPTKFPELGALKLPTLDQITLSNGLRIVVLEDHEVPLIRGSLLIKAGQYASPADKVGLASLSMSIQRAGGSLQHPGPVLNERLEALAAGIEAGAGQQSLSLDFSCNSEDLKEVLGLFSEVLRSPVLPEDRLKFYKEQVFNSLEHQNDNPDQVARRELQKLMYGKQSLYGRQPTVQGISSISIQDVKSFLAQWERPETAVMGLVGDFDTATVKELLENDLGSWTRADGQPEAPSRVTLPSDPLAGAAPLAGKVFLVNRPGMTQTSVVVAEPGVMLSDPDSAPLDVLSSILNSFGGKLFDQIRSREGLAYSVYGQWDSPPSRPGLFVGGGETSLPAEFLTSLRRVLEETKQEAPTEEELNAAKNETLNADVFNFASKSSQLQRTLVYDLLGLPADQLFRYKAGIEAVKPADVVRAAGDHLHPATQVTVLVGDAAKVKPQLEAAGFAIEELKLDPI